MQKAPSEPDRFFRMACYFEGALTLVAVLVGWLTDIDPFAHLIFAESALASGILLTLPLLLLFFALQHLPIPAIENIRKLLFETLGTRLHRSHWTDLLILAAIAGFSEEVLFRGALQPWLENVSGPMLGLIVSNVIFAMAHAVTPLYAILAFVMGVYLGLSLDYGGERNLLVPVIIHAAYDFVAFIAILRSYRNSL